MKLSNLEKIREAWRIGWAAVICDKWYENSVVVAVAPLVGSVKDSILISYSSNGTVISANLNPESTFSIIGYKYAGELAGNEEPREGQRFRIRGSKIVGEFYETYGHHCTSMHIVLKHHGIFPKNELAPYFE